MTGFSADRAAAVALDSTDPLARLRDRFVYDDPGLIYLDGNSLGRLPRATAERIGRVVREEWGNGLIGSWDHWIELPTRVGDLRDYRTPDRIRLGLAPITTRYVDVWDAMDRLRQIVAARADADLPAGA